LTEERRGEAREVFVDGVLYLHEMKTLSQAAQNGLAFDLSKTGACIYTQKEFSQGETIKVLCKKYGDAPIKSEICWCKKLDDNLFKVGLKFRDGAFS
jgi:hypothetical protein